MEIDIGNLLYIAFVLIILIANLLTKKKKKPGSPSPENQSPETVGPVPVDPRKSFEELLQEFTNPQQTAPPPPPPKPEPIPQPATRMEPIRPSNPMPSKKKEHSVMKTEYGKFDEFEKRKRKTSPYAEGFRGLDNAKKAFVYSEIFKKKF